MKDESIIGALAIEVARDILKYTPQLFRKVGTTEPIEIKPWASGVLLKIDDMHFLISAAHVLEDENAPIDPEDIGIMIGNIFHILNGSIKYSAKGIHPNNEKVDLIVWRIEDASIIKDLAEKYHFLEADDLDIEHNLASIACYLVVGFPVNKTEKQIETKKIKVAPFIFLTGRAESKLYQRLNFQEHSHIIIQYRKRKIKDFKGGFVMGPDPYGISGCGLWYLPSLKRNRNGKVTAKLVGIMHEWRREHAVMIATRIHIVTETLRESYGLTLPKSTITKLNLGNPI